MVLYKHVFTPTIMTPVTSITRITLVLTLWLPSLVRSQIAMGDAVVFVTSTEFAGDLLVTQPCATAVMFGSALVAYQSSSFSVFPLVADSTHNYNALLPGINTIYDANDATANYNWADTVTNNALGSLLADENGIYNSPALSFWSGANDNVYESVSDCKSFSSNNPGDIGHLVHTSFSVGLQSTVDCDSTERVLCAIIHAPPTPSSTPSPVPSPSPALAFDTAIVFMTSSRFAGDLSVTNPCRNAVDISSYLTAYQTGYAIFPLVADATRDYDQLIPSSTIIYDTDGYTRNYNWADTISNSALGDMLTNENGNHQLPLISFWSGANSNVHASGIDCTSFNSNFPSDVGHTVHASFDTNLQAIETCDSPQYVLCAITHEPSASPSISLTASVSVAPSVSGATSTSAAPSTSMVPNATPSLQVCSRL
jgi:hypothetical protein